MFGIEVELRRGQPSSGARGVDAHPLAAVQMEEPWDAMSDDEKQAVQWAVNDNFVLRQRELAGHVSQRTWQSSAEWRRAIELHDEVIAQSKYEKALLSDVANASQQSRDELRGLNELDATVRASLEDQHQVPNSSESLALKTLFVPVMP